MLKPRDLKFFAIGAVVVASGLSVFAVVTTPNTFTPNTPIKAEKVNANFSSLKASIEALQAGSGTVADGTLTSSKFADGAITPSKLADASVSAVKLITTAPASSGKFLSFDGSSLAWAAGTVGPQGPKGDTGSAGTQGLKGDTGAVGSAGATGATGPQGAKGDTEATGVTGSAGAAEVSGYQRVVNTLTSQTLAANSEVVLFSACPNGKRVVGGGFLVFSASGRWLASSSDPASDTQWAVALSSITGSTISAIKVETTAICVTVL